LPIIYWYYYLPHMYWPLRIISDSAYCHMDVFRIMPIDCRQCHIYIDWDFWLSIRALILLRSLQPSLRPIALWCHSYHFISWLLFIVTLPSFIEPELIALWRLLLLLIASLHYYYAYFIIDISLACWLLLLLPACFIAAIAIFRYHCITDAFFISFWIIIVFDWAIGWLFCRLHWLIIDSHCYCR